MVRVMLEKSSFRAVVSSHRVISAPYHLTHIHTHSKTLTLLQTYIECVSCIVTKYGAQRISFMFNYIG